MLSLPVISPRDSRELWSISNRRHNRHLLSSSHLSGSDPNGSSRGNNNHNPNNNTNNNTNGGGNGGGAVGVNTNQQHGSSSRYWSSLSFSPGGALSGAENLQQLQWEESNLRLRKKNIALFGYLWIKPAGCPKTMMGMREEEAEREEGLAAEAAAAASADFGVIGAGAGGVVGQGMDAITGMDDGLPGQVMMGDVVGGIGNAMDEVGPAGDPTMERDLDDDIPDAGERDDDEGLVEEGEEGLDEDDVNAELMERNLDDDIPEAYSSDPDDEDVFDENEDDEDDDFDGQHGLDDRMPGGEAVMGRYMVRDLDEDVPDAAEDRSQQEDEWQHTDTDAEEEDDDDDDDEDDDNDESNLNSNGPFAEQVQGNTRTPQHSHLRPTEAQRRFLQRWSGTTDVLESSGMMLDDDDDEEVRVSLASQGSRRISRFGRGFLRRGGPRDSLD